MDPHLAPLIRIYVYTNKRQMLPNRQIVDTPKKNQDALYQNDFGSSFHTLAFTLFAMTIAAQKIIDPIIFIF